jgi:hypothetical protein
VFRRSFRVGACVSTSARSDYHYPVYEGDESPNAQKATPSSALANADLNASILSISSTSSPDSPPQVVPPPMHQDPVVLTWSPETPEAYSPYDSSSNAGPSQSTARAPDNMDPVMIPEDSPPTCGSSISYIHQSKSNLTCYHSATAITRLEFQPALLYTPSLQYLAMQWFFFPTPTRPTRDQSTISLWVRTCSFRRLS